MSSATKTPHRLTVDEAAAYFGTRTALADALSITPAAVSQWIENVPPKQALELEIITGGRLRAVRWRRA